MATIGKTSDGASLQGGSIDRHYASIFTASSSGTIASAHARLWISATGSYGAKFVIWSVSGGVPVNRLAISDEVIVSSTTEAQVDFAFSGANATFAFVSGTEYALGLHLNDPGTPSYQISRDNTPNQTQRFDDNYEDGAAATWGTGATENGPIDVWAVYTEAGGSDPIIAGLHGIDDGFGPFAAARLNGVLQ